MHFNPDTVRPLFSALNQKVDGLSPLFLDGPGGAQVPQSVLDKMCDYLGHYNANLGGHYFSSKITTDLMASARQAGQALLNAPEATNIVFGPNMTSLTFQLSRAISRDWVEGDEVVVTALDHYSNVSSWQQAAEDKGAIVHQARVEPRDCTLDVEHLLSLISDKTRLVAVTAASNTTGSVVDLEAIIEKAHQVGAMVYVDAVHFAPHHLVDVQKLGCDFLVCSAYKFFGPHLGIAYVAPKWLHTLTPYKVEPATNEGPGRYETGTQSFEALAGFIATVDYLAQPSQQSLPLRQRLEQAFEGYRQHESAISERFLSRLERLNGVRLWGIEHADSQQRTPTFALTFDHHSPEEVAKALAKESICVWNGHFYALGLVKQLGLQETGGVVRIGFMHYNTLAEVDRLMDALEFIVTSG